MSRSTGPFVAASADPGLALQVDREQATVEDLETERLRAFHRLAAPCQANEGVRDAPERSRPGESTIWLLVERSEQGRQQSWLFCDSDHERQARPRSSRPGMTSREKLRPDKRPG